MSRKMSRVEAVLLKDRVTVGGGRRMSVAEIGFFVLLLYVLLDLTLL